MKISGKDIVAARGQAGLSQVELGALLGVSQTTISKWEMGTHSPASSMRSKLSIFMDEAKTMRPIEQVVKFSPYAISIMTREWTILVASPKIGEIERAPISTLCGFTFKGIATADMEQVVRSLADRGFFCGTTDSYRAIARGIHINGRPCAFDAVITPVPLDGEITMLTQVRLLDDQEYRSLRSKHDLVTLMR